MLVGALTISFEFDKAESSTLTDIELELLSMQVSCPACRLPRPYPVLTFCTVIPAQKNESRVSVDPRAGLASPDRE